MSLVEPVRPSASQTTRALLELRDLILSGELAPGERISELAVVERFGVSRTPVRAALLRLAEEGMLEVIAGGGYAVKAFSERDVHDAIELRGTLEGMAARFAAERGANPTLLSELKDVVASIDRIVGKTVLSADDFALYVQLNERFHAVLLEMADSDLLSREIERMIRLPFASPNGFVMAQAEMPESHLILTLAQEQHRCVVEAIELRQGERAEALMREHARLAHRNFRYALRDQRTIKKIQGAALLRQRHRA
jgi:GntR family transcriptional regulator of vanillate catabolism